MFELKCLKAIAFKWPILGNFLVICLQECGIFIPFSIKIKNEEHLRLILSMFLTFWIVKILYRQVFSGTKISYVRLGWRFICICIIYRIYKILPNIKTYCPVLNQPITVCKQLWEKGISTFTCISIVSSLRDTPFQ